MVSSQAVAIMTGDIGILLALSDLISHTVGRSMGLPHMSGILKNTGFRRRFDPG